jgi:hypothetical protein
MRTRVIWRTRCDRGELTFEEGSELYSDAAQVIFLTTRTRKWSQSGRLRVRRRERARARSLFREPVLVEDGLSLKRPQIR